ncbi:MAG TPA: hypothetical protein VFR97_01860 [Capillimicrobium sp.]|nr:hypothetical protein [Capillimicrobium sp.]
MTRLLALLCGALLVVAALTPPLAAAQRRPTAGERSRIANAVGVPKRCLVIRVSTVDERWSVAWMTKCDLEGGSAVFNYRRGLWRDSYTGPDEPSSVRCARIDFVRARVARDLELCR